MSKTRRLSDRIIEAHEQACREKRLDVAEILLQALEVEQSAMGGDKTDNREALANLEAAFERHERAKAEI